MNTHNELNIYDNDWGFYIDTEYLKYNYPNNYDILKKKYIMEYRIKKTITMNRLEIIHEEVINDDINIYDLDIFSKYINPVNIVTTISSVAACLYYYFR